MENEEIIKVAIIEDNHDIGLGIEFLLKGTEGFDCIGRFENYDSAVAAIPKIKHDVVLTDINLPGKNGIECIEFLKPKLPHTQFIMLTMYDDSELVFSALQKGATGYLLKRTPPDVLMRSIKEVYEGGSPMSMEIARMVVTSFKLHEKKLAKDANLTQRESEVLECLSKGMRYKEIADTLCINIETVRTHLRKIYEKLQVRSAAEAIIKFYKK